jgi:hypothetical protein
MTIKKQARNIQNNKDPDKQRASYIELSNMVASGKSTIRGKAN